MPARYQPGPTAQETKPNDRPIRGGLKARPRLLASRAWLGPSALGQGGFEVAREPGADRPRLVCVTPLALKEPKPWRADTNGTYLTRPVDENGITGLMRVSKDALKSAPFGTDTLRFADGHRKRRAWEKPLSFSVRPSVDFVHPVAPLARWCSMINIWDRWTWTDYSSGI